MNILLCLKTQNAGKELLYEQLYHSFSLGGTLTFLLHPLLDSYFFSVLIKQSTASFCLSFFDNILTTQYRRKGTEKKNITQRPERWNIVKKKLQKPVLSQQDEEQHNHNKKACVHNFPFLSLSLPRTLSWAFNTTWSIETSNLVSVWVKNITSCSLTWMFYMQKVSERYERSWMFLDLTQHSI